jgi:hypothetical protein
MRSRLVFVSLLLALATTAWAQTQFVVEDWSSRPVGAKGIPEGWKAQNWGSPKYDLFTIENDGGKKVLHMKSANDGSTIARDV